MHSRTLHGRTLLKSRKPHLLLRSFFSSTANSSFQTSENEIDDNNKKPKSVKWHGFPRKPVRSLFYVPGSSKRMLEKAWTLNVDNITLDLEDSVHETEKVIARNQVVEAIKEYGKHPTAEIAVRINVRHDGPQIDTEEIRALCPVMDHIDAIVLPKFSYKNYHHLSATLQELRKNGSYLGVKRVYGLIETPVGVVGLPEFVRGIDKHSPLPGVALSGLIFGAEDFATAMGITRSPTLIEMLYARQLVVAVSKTKQINCIDLVSTNFRDLDALRLECEQGASFGFTGKQVIHPNQISVVHEAFSPSASSIDWAERLLTQYVEETSSGKRGAWEFEGKMVDRPVILKAENIIQLAYNYGIEIDRTGEVLQKVREAYQNQMATSSLSKAEV